MHVKCWTSLYCSYGSYSKMCLYIVPWIEIHARLFYKSANNPITVLNTCFHTWLQIRQTHFNDFTQDVQMCWHVCCLHVNTCVCVLCRPGGPMMYPPGFTIPDGGLIKQEPGERCVTYTITQHVPKFIK